MSQFITDGEFERIKHYLINAVESRECGFEEYETLEVKYNIPDSLVRAELRQIVEHLVHRRLGKYRRHCLLKVLLRQTVLIEKRKSEQYSHGFSGSYVPVRIYGEALERHSLVRGTVPYHSACSCV